MLHEAFIAEVESHKWAMEQSAFVAFVNEVKARAAKPDLFERAEPPRMTVSKGVATIPIRGPLMVRVPGIVRLLGMEATEYSEIRDMVADALKNKSVIEISYTVDSGGGTVSGSLETAKAIYEADKLKPSHSIIQSIGASGAYLLASQVSRIFANSPNSIIGSIGVTMPVIDSSKAAEMQGVTVHLIKSGEIKGTGFPGTKVTESQIAAHQELVDGMAANMIEAIARGRGKPLSEIQKLATGQTWLADKAITLGLADEVRPNNIIYISERALAMDEKEVQCKVDAAVQKATNAVLTSERNRVAEITNAIPEDPAFALVQIQAGKSPLEAKSAYADILSERNKELKAELSKKAKSEEKTVVGATPLEPGESTAEEKSFGQLVSEYKQEHKCSAAKASAEVNRLYPGLYEKGRKA